MRVYVVVQTDGDYVGYFESEVLGVFKKIEDAEACKADAVKSGNWCSNSRITIEEREVK